MIYTFRFLNICWKYQDINLSESSRKWLWYHGPCMLKSKLLNYTTLWLIPYTEITVTELRYMIDSVSLNWYYWLSLENLADRQKWAWKAIWKMKWWTACLGLKHATLLWLQFRSFHLTLENMHIHLTFRTVAVFAKTIYVWVLVEIYRINT